MIFKFIRKHLTGAIKRGGWGGNRRQFTGENSACIIVTKTKLPNEKMLPNSSRCLTVSSITFILYNNPTINNCFHFCKYINKLINQLIAQWQNNYLN